MRVHWVEVKLRSAHGGLMPICAVLHTFLHELAHTVTLPERRTAVPDGLGRTLQIQMGSRLDKQGRYFAVHHPPAFYQNYAQLLRAAGALGILALPTSGAVRHMTPRNLQRYDALLDPNDCISLGSSPRFGGLAAAPNAPRRAPLAEVPNQAAVPAAVGGKPAKKKQGKRMSRGRR